MIIPFMPPGRRSAYNPKYVDDVQRMQGLTRNAIAAKFGVSKMTLYNWTATYPEFAAAINFACKASPHRGSPPRLYQREFCDRARKILSAQGTKKDVARGLRTTLPVLNRWMAEYPEFRKAIEEGQAVKHDSRSLRPGRPEVPFLDKYIDAAREIMRTGATMERLAIELGVSPSLLKNWVKERPELKSAIDEGRAFANSLVQTSLFRRAVGYTYTEEVVETVTGAQGERTMTRQATKHMAGDPRCQELFLRNRMPDEWTQGTGSSIPAPSLGVLLGQMTPDQVASADRVVEYLDSRKVK